MRLDALARHLGGELSGDPGIEVEAVVPPEEARPGTVVVLSDRRRQAEAEAGGSVLILPAGAPASAGPTIRVPHIRIALARTLQILTPRADRAPGIHATCLIGRNVRVGAGVYLGPYVVIGDGVEIGDGAQVHAHAVLEDGAVVGPHCRLDPHVTVRRDCRLGARVILQSSAVIGADGFGYAQDARRRHLLIPQIGRVELGDDVEIGALSAVDRATLGVTRLGRGTKLDNQVHVGHNVEIGEDCAIAAGVVIGGSTRIGNRVLIGGYVGIRDHAVIGDGAVVYGDSAVWQDVAEGEVVAGHPAHHHIAQRRSDILVRRLPALFKRVEALEERLRRFEGR